MAKKAILFILLATKAIFRINKLSDKNQAIKFVKN